MNKLGMYVFLMTALLSLVGCGGGGGSTSTGGTHYTHEQLANEFVRRVNSDVYGYDLQLVKSNTLKYDYIVVYDYQYRTYDAYYIGAYNVGENMANYMNSYSSYFYYGLQPDGTNVYVDPYTFTRFEKQEVSSKNLAKIQAVKEQLSVSSLADKLRVQYGLSADKSLDIASFAYKVENSPKGTFKAQDYDSFVKELTGSSITDFKGDILSGNSTSLEARIQEASKMTGMGSEGVNRLITDLFSAN